MDLRSAGPASRRRPRGRAARHGLVHVLDNLEVGGAQRLVLTHARHAVATGTPVTVVSLNASSDDRISADLRAAGADVVVLDHRTAVSAVANGLKVAQLVRVLRRSGTRSVQTHLLYANVLGALAARLSGLPVVATLHSAQVGGDGNSRRALALERAVLRTVPGAVVAVGAVVEQAQRQRLAPRTVEVVPNAVEPGVALTEDQRTRLRASLGAGRDTVLVLAVGRLDTSKGYDELLTAFAVVARRSSGALLAVAGDGPRRASLQERVRQDDLRGRVVLLGNRSDVRELLAAADLYVSASHWEGLPLALLEAMAAGLPVVSTAVGDVPSAVDQTCGVLVPPRAPAALTDALTALLDDPGRRQALGAAARERVSVRFGVPGWVARLEEVHAAAGSGPERRRGRR